MSATKVTKRRMSLVTLVSTMFLLATLAWALTTFYFVQTGNVRTQTPHEEYSEIEEWPYDLDWAGGRTNWFDDINYTDMPMDQELPDDLLDHLEDVIFAVEPENPPQLWRKTAYDSYSGSSWSKSLDSTEPLSLITQEQAESQNNTVYRLFLNVTVGPNVGSIELPSLFPEAQLIEDSFRTYPENRLREYDLEIDEYGTVLFSPLLEGTTGETVLVSYQLTYANQDIDSIENNAQPGTSAPAEVSSLYSTLEGVDLTQRVIDNVSQFEDVGDDAYEKAMAVDLYFRNTFELMIGQDEYQERPEEGREVTDWFLERGGGLPMDFATAYSVFMRQLDIPARMVAGYAVGEVDNGRRVVKVKHMIFYSEVYIPTAGGGGEWIQVIPLPLSGDLGVTEIPENTGQGDVELWLWPSSLQPWAIIGEPFNLSSLLLVQNQPVSAPETIHFYDNTDDVYIGNTAIEQGSSLPLANITYTFPSSASTGAHNISATWHGSSFSITNYTLFYAVGQPDPLHPKPSPKTESDFVISETVDLNLKLGLDNYTAYWEDTLHVHGLMTRDGEPVDGTTLDNDQMQIMWDEGLYGNATIQSDGTYELDIFVDPADLMRMTTGSHEVWASYAGEYENGIPILLPAESENRSVVTLYGRVGFNLSVSPQSAYRGSSIQYEGILHLLNGTPLAFEEIGVYFDENQVDTTITNDSGGFTSSYTIPPDQPIGNFSANVNWTSSYDLVAGNWSTTYNIQIRSGLTNLSIESDPQDPDPVHIWEILTVNGSLRDAINGSGLEGYNVSLWWKNGTDTRVVANDMTGADGYYEFNYNVSAGYEGEVTYWVEFNPSGTQYESCQSDNLTITVKRWDLQIDIETNPNPVHLLETLTINGSVYLPENSSVMQGVQLTVWWHNSTGTHNLTGLITNSAGDYSYEYTIPFYHELDTVEIWVSAAAPSPAISGNESTHISEQIINYTPLITVSSNSTIYHLNETVHINGTLLVNGTPMNDTIVYIHWNNGTLQTFNVTTDAAGIYDFYYNLTMSDGPSTVTVDVNYTSTTRLYADATEVLDPPLTLQLYQLHLTGITNATEYHLDEVIEFSGTLSFVENGAPIAGETVFVYYENSTDIYQFNKTTDSTGAFRFLYNLTTSDELGYVYLWSQYISSNPLWESTQSLDQECLLKLYQLDLNCTTNRTHYHLNETVQISGYLTYQTNGTPIEGQNVTIFWDWNNGTIQTFPAGSTNGTGGYTYYYNLSVSRDETAVVTIWAESNNSVGLWDNATSVPGIDVHLVLYTPVFSMDVASSVYLDQNLIIQGNLTYTGGSPALQNANVTIYNWTGTFWAPLTTITTNSTGGFRYIYTFEVPPNGPGEYKFQCNYTSSNALVANATSGDIAVIAEKYSTTLTLSVSPNPVYLNETLFFDGNLTFVHNSSGVSGAHIVIWWNNGTTFLLDNVTTDDSGSFSFSYSKMDEDTIWTGIEVFADYSGTLFISSSTTAPGTVTLQQWITHVTFDVSDYSPSPTDTITIYGNLSIEGNPYANTPVQILFDGTPVATGTTASNGTFSINWQIPSSTSTGDHDIVVQYWSTDNWIADYTSASPITLNVTRITIEWTLSATPSTVYLSEYLHVSGTVTLDNGSPYAGATIEIYWYHVLGGEGEELLFSLVTNDTGDFERVFAIDISTPIGITYIFANCTPSEAYIASGSSSMIVVDIQQIPVDITGTVSNSTVYLGESRIFSGTLTFGNGTAMTGYWVEFYIGGDIVANTTVEDSGTGYFELEYVFPWTLHPNDTTYQIRFARPNEAYTQSSTAESSLEIWDRVEIDLSEQEVYTIRRGEGIRVNGIVTNGGGPVENLEVVLTANGTITYAATVTNNSGAFEIYLPTYEDTGKGLYIVSSWINESNYEIEQPLDTWSVTVQIPSETGVELVTDRSLLPGENLTTRISLHDADGDLVRDTSVMVYLNSTLLLNYSIDTLDLVTLQIPIPESWRQSGYFVLRAYCPGGLFTTSSSAEETSLLHIFIDYSFNANTPSRVAPGQDFAVSGGCIDAEGRPIMNRDVVIDLNGTTTEPITTNQEGRISYDVTAPDLEGDFTYEITLLSATGDLSLGSYTVEVRRATSLPTNTLLSLGWIAIIGVEVVVGLVVIRRYRYSGRPRHRDLSFLNFNHLDSQDSFTMI